MHTTQLTCACGATFHRADDYLASRRTDVLWRWKSTCCDACVAAKQEAALKRLPEVMTALTSP